MTQEKIVESLQKALKQGSGNLDDLSNLLTRVQSDIENAKKEQEEAKKKAENARGMRVAEIATRLLNRELTEVDMAFIMSEYFNVTFTVEDVKKLNSTTEAADKIAKSLDQLADNLAKAFKSAEKPIEKTPDDIITKFLKDFGLD